MVCEVREGTAFLTTKDENVTKRWKCHRPKQTAIAEAFNRLRQILHVIHCMYTIDIQDIGNNCPFSVSGSISGEPQTLDWPNYVIIFLIFNCHIGSQASQLLPWIRMSKKKQARTTNSRYERAEQQYLLNKYNNTIFFIWISVQACSMKERSQTSKWMDTIAEGLQYFKNSWS